MSHFSPLKIVIPSFENALRWLADHGFELTQQAGGQVYTVSKYGCTASIEPGLNGQTRIAAFPALFFAGEPAVLIDRGYQKFLQTSKLEMGATAEQLQTLHRFAEELKEGLGYTSLYNEGLGSVSSRYRYDRIVGRDLPPSSRPARPWQR